jgi:hypothetical protein
MVLKKTTHRTYTKKIASTNKQHVVTLTVKNGPFKTKDHANQAKTTLHERGIATGSITKTAKGYCFASRLGYRVPSLTIRDKVVSKLKSHASAAGLPKKAFSVTTRRI